MGQIKAIITDFDGTLVNTFISNFYAYKKAIPKIPILSEIISLVFH